MQCNQQMFGFWRNSVLFLRYNCNFYLKSLFRKLHTLPLNRFKPCKTLVIRKIVCLLFFCTHLFPFQNYSGSKITTNIYRSKIVLCWITLMCTVVINGLVFLHLLVIYAQSTDNHWLNTILCLLQSDCVNFTDRIMTF